MSPISAPELARGDDAAQPPRKRKTKADRVNISSNNIEGADRAVEVRLTEKRASIRAQGTTNLESRVNDEGDDEYRFPAVYLAEGAPE